MSLPLVHVIPPLAGNPVLHVFDGTSEHTIKETGTNVLTLTSVVALDNHRQVEVTSLAAAVAELARLWGVKLSDVLAVASAWGMETGLELREQGSGGGSGGGGSATNSTPAQGGGTGRPQGLIEGSGRRGQQRKLGSGPERG